MGLLEWTDDDHDVVQCSGCGGYFEPHLVRLEEIGGDVDVWCDACDEK